MATSVANDDRGLTKRSLTLPDVNARKPSRGGTKAPHRTRGRSTERRQRLSEAADKYAANLAHLHRKRATGISNLVASPGHGLDLTTFGRFLDFHLPISWLPTPGSKAYRLMRASVQDRAWAQDAFQCKQPTSRQDALDLRDWLHGQLSSLNASADLSPATDARLKYAEQALNLYNAAYHELTRQVSLGCVERGHLMADLWTSQAELVSRVLTEVKQSDDAHTAMSNALHRKQAAVSEACDGLQVKYAEAKAENAALAARIMELEAALRTGERKAWGVVAES